MKPLVLDARMTTMRGIFYPRGHVFALFPDEPSVLRAVQALHAVGHAGDAAHAPPETLLHDVEHTLGSTADAPMPSVGAEGDMVRRIADWARRGYHGLLIPVGDKSQVRAIVDCITPHGAAAALHYRMLVIEELIDSHDSGEQSVLVGTHALAR